MFVLGNINSNKVHGHRKNLLNKYFSTVVFHREFGCVITNDKDGFEQLLTSLNSLSNPEDIKIGCRIYVVAVRCDREQKEQFFELVSNDFRQLTVCAVPLL